MVNSIGWLCTPYFPFYFVLLQVHDHLSTNSCFVVFVLFFPSLWFIPIDSVLPLLHVDFRSKFILVPWNIYIPLNYCNDFSIDTVLISYYMFVFHCLPQLSPNYNGWFRPPNLATAWPSATEAQSFRRSRGRNFRSEAWSGNAPDQLRSIAKFFWGTMVDGS